MSKKNLFFKKKKIIGNGLTPFIIAEIGTNHDRDFSKVKDLIDKLVVTGCDCIKFQIYEAEEIVSKKVKVSDYGLDNIYGNISASEMFDKFLKTPKEWFPELTNLIHKKGLYVAATVHGSSGIEWAKKQNFDLIKVASMDHNNIPFLENLVNNINTPILASFGMAKIDDLNRSIEILNRHKHGFGIFYCVSIYPPKFGDISLKNITFLDNKYKIPIGFSDHTTNDTTACAALMCGASFFEKHVTYDKTKKGPDHAFALEPNELKKYVYSLKETFSFIGSENYIEPSESEFINRKKYLKSLISKKNLKSGDIITSNDIYLARPGTGIEPRFYNNILGQELKKDVEADEPLEWHHFREEKLSKY